MSFSNTDKSIQSLTLNPELVYKSKVRNCSKRLIDVLEAKAYPEDDLLDDLTAEVSENKSKIIKQNYFNTI